MIKLGHGSEALAGLRGGSQRDRRGRATRPASRWEVLSAALDALGSRVRKVHVHLDMDVLDPTAVSPANEFAPDGGLLAAELEACIRKVREHLEIGSATVASYDPSFDHEGALIAGRDGVRSAVEHLGSPQT